MHIHMMHSFCLCKYLDFSSPLSFWLANTKAFGGSENNPRLESKLRNGEGMRTSSFKREKRELWPGMLLPRKLVFVDCSDHKAPCVRCYMLNLFPLPPSPALLNRKQTASHFVCFSLLLLSITLFLGRGERGANLTFRSTFTKRTHGT